MFRFLLHPLALAVLVTLLIWFAVIVYWQQTVRLVTAQDIGIYLVGLPLAAIALGFGLRALFRRPRQPDAKAAATPAAAPAAATDESERGFTLALLAVGMASAAGDDAGANFQALKAKELQPLPDAELRNRDGFPVHASRAEALAVQEVEAAFEALASPPRPPGMLRAQALLKLALAPALEFLATVAPEPDKRGHVVPAVRLSVDLLLPAAWDERDRNLAARHVGGLIVDAGWPAAAFSLATMAGDDGTLALRRLDAFSLKANRAESGDLYLLAAADSTIDEDLVAALESRGHLFGSANGQGQIPGEAAAAVLARAPKNMPKGSMPTALVGRTALAARDKSADAAGRVSHETLLTIAQSSLTAASVQPADIGLVVSDADQRGSRSAESLVAINSLLPELDPAKDSIAAGQALGRLGAAGALAALGVAAAAAEAEDKPVLLMSVSHPTERAAALVRPFAEPTSPAA